MHAYRILIYYGLYVIHKNEEKEDQKRNRIKTNLNRKRRLGSLRGIYAKRDNIILYFCRNS